MSCYEENGLHPRQSLKTGPNVSMFHLGVTLGYGKEGKISELIDKVEYASF